MTGFESYCEKTEIDFTKLNSSGIFLISGETGAGKTTIFDAMTFALYGSPSGEKSKRINAAFPFCKREHSDRSRFYF
ncbi:MAG: AAA family ATPase [Treponema sp.]